MVVLGVELRTTPKQPSTVSVLDCRSDVIQLDSAGTDDEIVQIAEDFRPSRIAIGRPLGLPEGRCCLEIKCSCALINPHKKGRQSELELSRLGISCFFTTQGSIIRPLIYRAIGLKDRLKSQGFKVIEVNPYASKVLLFGDGVPRKNTKESTDYMKERLPGLVGNLESRLNLLNSNKCDALINAYTALLHSRKDTIRLGNPNEGFLMLPKLLALTPGSVAG